MLGMDQFSNIGQPPETTSAGVSVCKSLVGIFPPHIYSPSKQSYHIKGNKIVKLKSLKHCNGLEAHKICNVQ